MIQSDTEYTNPEGLHVGMIMDGNGRWAAARGQPRLFGHRRGAKVVTEMVETAPALGIGTLTLYAFSSDNWKRPAREVSGLMRLFRSYLASETARCVENGVRLCIIGRRDRLSPALIHAIQAAEQTTRAGKRLLLRIAIDYSARDSIVAAARCAGECFPGSREEFGALIARVTNSPVVPEVDLLIRTGGEQRLSDFLLWECAYAELAFPDCMWPEMDARRLGRVIEDFHSRERRFGGLAHTAAAS
ncbi:MAG: di-trans,poly-cis-decaprenylcistransferase [Gemmatimonadota bacterium]|jgi:undecaprenyl diphosphate synthase|nr:di-trans,poly-cis-decaprenylcistransferase [Gemmatimonadota bacterium]